MDPATRVQILDEAVCISHSSNTLEKCINQTIPSIVGQTDSLTLVWQPVKKEISEFKPVKIRLKIDLVSQPARAEGLGKNITEHCLSTYNSFCFLLFPFFGPPERQSPQRGRFFFHFFILSFFFIITRFCNLTWIR